MHQMDTRLRNQMVFFAADGRSASAMHFHRTDETGICSSVLLLKVVTLDLVTKHCWLTEEPKTQTTESSCLKVHIATIEI